MTLQTNRVRDTRVGPGGGVSLPPKNGVALVEARGCLPRNYNGKDLTVRDRRNT